MGRGKIFILQVSLNITYLLWVKLLFARQIKDYLYFSEVSFIGGFLLFVFCLVFLLFERGYLFFFFLFLLYVGFLTNHCLLT